MPGSDMPQMMTMGGPTRFGYGYSLSVSNDGIKYSNPLSILSFDTKCVNCGPLGNCSLKVGLQDMEEKFNLNFS